MVAAVPQRRHGLSATSHSDSQTSASTLQADEFQDFVASSVQARADLETMLENHKSRMKNTLQHAAVTFDSFCERPCDGLMWRHGYFTCPYESVLTAQTAYFRHSVTRNGRKQLQVLPYCFRCASLRKRIFRWLAEGKYTVGGVHLCRKGRLLR
ncbi:hypothetical protein CHU98_g10277 [Xylaria longipes]|nr:hypothetical protein CHU98_g10277 [Xylaria longipes]